MTTEANAYETPLLDRLRSVPFDARDMYSHGGPFKTRLIPYGRHCHDAAAEIARLQAQAQEDVRRRVDLAAALDSKDAEIRHLRSTVISVAEHRDQLFADKTRLQAQVDALAVALRADAAAIEDGIRHDEYCDRANAEGWDNDPTGSSHISSSASRLRALQERAAAMKRAALAAVGR